MKIDNEYRQEDGGGITWPAPLLDAASAIAKRKVTVLFIALIGIVIAIVRLMGLPTVYKASAVAVLMSRDKPILDASIDTSSIETTDDRASRSQSGSLMLPPNPALYTTLIKSRAVISRIAKKYEERLSDHLSPADRSDEVVQQLKSMVQVTSTEEGLITVTVSANEARLSAELANEFFEECKLASKAIERQLVLQQAGHLDDALRSAMSRLEESEKTLGVFTSKYGLVNLDLQVGNQLRSVRELDAQKDSLESKLIEMRVDYSERSPEVRRLSARIEAIEEIKANAMNNIVGPVGVSEFGEIIVRLESLKQKARFERDLVATLSTKADIYRIRADQPTGNLAIVRAALAPDRPAGPSKKRELGIVLGLFAFIAIAWCLASHQWELAMADSYLAGRVGEIRRDLLSQQVWERLIAWKKSLGRRLSLKGNV